MPSCVVPFDVWSAIAEYFPPDTLLSFSLVNRAFYELAQKVKYQATDLITYDKNTKKLLRELKNPSCGSFVRTVHIQPWKVSDVVKPPPRRRRRLLDKLHALVDAEYALERSKAVVQKRLNKQLAMVLDTFSRLQNVLEYRIEWDETPNYHAEFFRAFLCPLLADTSFGQTLVKFSIKVPVERLPCLATVHLPSLQELDVQLYTGKVPPQEVAYLLDSFAVFVNNLYHTLRSLAVTSTFSSQNLNLNRFFHHLGDFPSLRSFALSTPWDGVHVWAPVDAPFPLQTFIGKHSRQLQELKLLCSRIGTSPVPVDPAAKDWIQRILGSIDDRFHLLSRLELDLRNLRSQTGADLGGLVKCLEPIASQLESLVLTECPLWKCQVERILQLFPRSAGEANLRMLALRLQRLTPEVVDLLASRLPFLRSLELTFAEVEGALFGSRSEKLDTFLARMSGRRYASWQLSRLALSESPKYVDLKWMNELEQAFVECIPSLHHVAPLPPLQL